MDFLRSLTAKLRKIFEAITGMIKRLKKSKIDHALSNLQKNKLILA